MSDDFLSVLADTVSPAERISRWYCDRPNCTGDPHGEHWRWCSHVCEGLWDARRKKCSLPECTRKAKAHHDDACRHARAAQVPPDGDWFLLMLLTGRGFGKLLRLTTVVPTPSGWTTMGALAVGDQVFDEDGNPCSVTGVYDGVPERVYRLSFSDGTELVAGGEHEWVTWTHAERKAFGRSPYEAKDQLPVSWPTWRLKRAKGNPTRPPRVFPDSPGPQIRTTDEIVATLSQGKRHDYNHAIPLARALALPERLLPVDPYVLGAWLGDGSTGGGGFTGIDPPILERIEKAGFKVSHSANGKTHHIQKLVGALRDLGVLDDKHVPSVYLRASIDQRLALLQGLMDTDGTIGTNGQAEFTSTKRELAEAVIELVRSLGGKPTLGEGRATLYGKDCGPKYRVCWKPLFPPVSLPRKVDRLKPPGVQNFRNLHRMIVGADSLPVEPMRCITVDSPNRMYLVGDGMIPTHNSRAAAEWLVNSAITQDPAEWCVLARNASDVLKNARDMKAGIVAIAERDGILTQYNRHENDIILTNGAVIHCISAEKPDKLRGFNLAGGWADELSSWKYAEETWNYGLLPALRIGAHPRVVVTTTPKPVPLLQKLVAEAKKDEALPIEQRSRILVTGSTFDNAKNLSTQVLDEMQRNYGGTRLARQELDGELIFDLSGALITMEMIELNRVSWDAFRELGGPEAMQRIVVAVDPAGTYGEQSDETGIVVCAKGPEGHGYLLEDRSMKGSPRDWAVAVVGAYEKWGADRVIAEVNIGNDLVEEVIRAVAPGIPYTGIRALVGKRLRAEPVAALYEQNMIHHVGDKFGRLEEQLLTWTPEVSMRNSRGTSPDRMDAMVHGFTELGLVRWGVGHGWMKAMKESLRKDAEGVPKPQGPRRDMSQMNQAEMPASLNPTMCKQPRYFGPEKICVQCGGGREQHTA